MLFLKYENTNTITTHPFIRLRRWQKPQLHGAVCFEGGFALFTQCGGGAAKLVANLAVSEKKFVVAGGFG